MGFKTQPKVLIEEVVKIDRGEVLGVEVSECFVGTDRLDKFGSRNASREEFGFDLLRFAFIVGSFGNSAKEILRTKVRSTRRRDGLDILELLGLGGGVSYCDVYIDC